jgi:hypothetical protein
MDVASFVKTSEVWAVLVRNLAVLSFVLSVAAIGWSVYQWFYVQRQTRINTAVELSRIYLVDKTIQDGFYLFLDHRSEFKELKGESRAFLSARSFVDFLEYVSFLVNEDRVDNRYISVRIKCDIAFAFHEISKDQTLRGLFRERTAMEKYFNRGEHKDCSDWKNR